MRLSIVPMHMVRDYDERAIAIDLLKKMGLSTPGRDDCLNILMS